MNKKISFFCGVMSFFIFTGCLQIPLNYTPEASLPEKNAEKQYSITFSVDYLSDGYVSIGRASQEHYIKWLNEYLQKCGSFSSVTYKPFDQKSNYHLHFIAHYSCMPVNEAALLGFVMGYTMCTIPMMINMHLDTTAILYLNGSPIYSPATAETLRCYVWIPFLPVGMIWNQYWAWTTQETKCCRYLINEIVDYQQSHLQ